MLIRESLERSVEIIFLIEGQTPKVASVIERAKVREEP